MDPFTQGSLGALASQSFSKTKEFKWAFLIGVLSGMAPDLDILIRSEIDPMIYYLYHRHFTHSLLFVPIGAFIVSSFLHIFLKNKIGFKQNYLYSILGYGTHGLLDACTSYGTLLFWPVSDHRFAWNNVSIIDPLFTLPLIFFIIFSIRKKNHRIARIGMLYVFCYLSIGVVQGYRAEDIGYELAKSRGHTPQRLTARPSLGNLYLWRVLYEHEGYFYADAVKVGLSPRWFTGEKIKKLSLEEDFPWVEKGSQHSIDIEKFRWFSKDYLAVHPDDKNAIGDVRYSLSPDSIYPLWGIELSPESSDQHVKNVNFRMKSLKLRERYLELLLNRN